MKIKILFKVIDLSVLSLLLITLDILDWMLLLVFVSIINTSYYVSTKKSSKRINWWYEFSISADRQDEVYLHFAPSILIGYWADSSLLKKYRSKALNDLKAKGYSRISGKTISLVKINESTNYSEAALLKKWSKEGIVTLISTIFITLANLRSIVTLTVSRKIYLLIFKHPYKYFIYGLSDHGAEKEAG